MVPYIPGAVKNFYYSLMGNEKLVAIINKHSSRNRLEQTLIKHIGEWFAGVLNEDYIEKRNKIAKMHVHIQLEGTAKRCTDARLLGYNSVKNRVKRVILEKNGKEAGCTVARYERDKVGFSRVGYIYKRTIIRESDGSETILHTA